MPIDPSKIKPGDTVRVRLHTHSMEKAGVDPIEFTTKAYAGYDGAPCVADSFLYSNALTILGHIPARPDWADALVVRDARGLLLLAAEFMGDLHFLDRNSDLWEVRELEERHGPITVVIDADGNPARPEVEWLDAAALDELPTYAVIWSDASTHGQVARRVFGGWLVLGGSFTDSSANLAPARVLWTEGDL